MTNDGYTFFMQFYTIETPLIFKNPIRTYHVVLNCWLVGKF